MQSMSDVASFSAALRSLAVDLSRISSDLRLLASGPRTGLDEIVLPAVQPGSSIMPGKANPSIAEMVNQVCFQVVGNDTRLPRSRGARQPELNVMMPVIAHNVLFSMRILANAVHALDERCVRGIEANEEQCAYWLERSAALATALAPRIGYAKAAALAKESVKSGELIRDLAAREKILPAEELAKVLDLRRMTEIGVPGSEKATGE
jgi:aspartate ammonia-lyase